MWDKRVEEKLAARRAEALAGGGVERIAKQHGQGKLTARERLELLFDADTFIETGGFIKGRIHGFNRDKKHILGDGVVTGYGKIHGQTVFAASEDFTVHGGTMGEYHLRKICALQDMAFEAKAPIVFINDSGGARIEEGISSLAEMGGLFYRNTRASGITPQIAVIAGPCAGGACYSPAICDFIFMVEQTGLMFITGPKVVKAVTNEEISPQELGGANLHGTKSGVAHFTYKDEKSCMQGIRQLLTYLPGNAGETAPRISYEETNLCKGLQEVVVQDRRKCYDMHTVIGAIADKQSFFEIHKDYAKNALVGLGRIEGASVGFVANQPNYMGGSIDVNASDKMARFIRFCDCFNIPIITLVDVPAFLPGKEQEHMGIIRHGAKLLYAYSEATVPKITLILRKAYGGAYIAMGSKLMGADLVLAWPIAEIAVMGAEGAVNILYGRVLQQAKDPEAFRKERIDEYEEQFLNPYIAAECGYVDEIVLPTESRSRIAGALRAFEKKGTAQSIRKHGNIPL